MGVLSTLAGTQAIASLLPGVSPTDPWVFAAASAFLLAIAVVATVVPAFGATRVDPLVALHCD